MDIETKFLISCGIFLVGILIALINLAIMRKKGSPITSLMLGIHIGAEVLYSLSGIMVIIFGIIWGVEKLV